MLGIASTKLHDVGTQSVITVGQNDREKVSTIVLTTTKPLVKPSQANENQSAIPVENGAPCDHLNGMSAMEYTN